MRLSCASAMVESSVISGWPALTRSPSRALIVLDDPALEVLDHDVLPGGGDVACRDGGAGERRSRRPQAEPAEAHNHEQIAERGYRADTGVDGLGPSEAARFFGHGRCLSFPRYLIRLGAHHGRERCRWLRRLPAAVAAAREPGSAPARWALAGAAPGPEAGLPAGRMPCASSATRPSPGRTSRSGRRAASECGRIWRRSTAGG